MKLEKFLKLKHHSPGGFTLLELIVVIFIIGMLVTISIFSTTAVRAKSSDTKRLGDMKDLGTAIELYYSNNDSYPDCSVCSDQAGWDSCLQTALAGIMVLPTDPKNKNSYRYCYSLIEIAPGPYVSLLFALERPNPNATHATLILGASDYFQYRLNIPDY